MGRVITTLVAGVLVTTACGGGGGRDPAAPTVSVETPVPWYENAAVTPTPLVSSLRCSAVLMSLEVSPIIYGPTFAQDPKSRMGNAMTVCPGFKEKFDATVAKSADKWLDGIPNLPDGARQAIRPATIVWLEATDPLAQAKASADMEQTLLLWLNLNRPRPVAVIPAPDNSLQQFDIDQMKQKLRDLQNCIEFGTIC